MSRPRILLAGGGTGGHIFPLIAIARSLKEKGAEVAFIGPEEFTLEAVRAENIKIKKVVRAGKFRRYFSLSTISDTIKLPFAIGQSYFFIRSWKPDVLLGKGGYGSITPVVAAWMCGVPIVLHESDAIPGLANKFLKKFATKILLGFENARKYFYGIHTEIVGNPVRSKFLGITKSQARNTLKFDTHRKVIFVIGGSQGALSVNELIVAAAPMLLKKYALVVATGQNSPEATRALNVNNALVKTFLNEKELAAAYTLSDIVVSRAGAGGIFEISTFAKPSVLLPLGASTGGHQLANAREYENYEAAIVLEEEKVTEQTLLFAIESVILNIEIASHMSLNAKKFTKIKSDERIAEILIDITKNRKKTS